MGRKRQNNPIVTDVQSLTPDQCVYFRDQLRAARAEAFSNAEGFQSILYGVEKLGTTLTKRVQDLGKYGPAVTNIADKSPLASLIPTTPKGRHVHTPFADLYHVVQQARNDALHHGAFARHLTTHATQLALVIEDALMETVRETRSYTVADFMVRDPVVAATWQPVSLVRQQMLANSFSYLPIYVDATWYFISDKAVAKYLRESNEGRKARLAKTVEEAIHDGLEYEQATTHHADALINDIVQKIEAKPVLVTLENREDVLVGIVAPFDLL